MIFVRRFSKVQVFSPMRSKRVFRRRLSLKVSVRDHACNDSQSQDVDGNRQKVLDLATCRRGCHGQTNLSGLQSICLTGIKGRLDDDQPKNEASARKVWWILFPGFGTIIPSYVQFPTVAYVSAQMVRFNGKTLRMLPILLVWYGTIKLF